MTALIAGYARTPFMKMNGSLSSFSAVALGTHAVKGALSSAGISPADVDLVFAGQVLQAGCGQNPARQVSIGAGIPLSTPAMTLNAVCLSGIEAVAAAVRAINAGEAEIVVAVGQESMSQAPHAWVGSRQGTKYGPVTMVDTLEFDGLTDAFELRSMGVSTEEFGKPLNITRNDQDVFAAASHQNALASVEFTSGEIVPVELTVRGKTSVLSVDDGIRADTTVDTLSQLRPAFGAEGAITAGNSSQLTDGAAAIVIMSEAAAARLKVTPIAKILATAFVAGPDVSLHAQPSNAITAAAQKAGVKVADLSAVEINEAFASVGIHSTRELGLNPETVNANGGAIALGHPIGASGARIVGHLARRVNELGQGTLGAAGICGGGGQGSAVIIEAL